MWSRKKYFEITSAPSEIPANLPVGPIQPFWADVFALGRSGSGGMWNFKIFFCKPTFHHHF